MSKFSGMNGIWTQISAIPSAVLDRLSYQAKSEMVMWVRHNLSFEDGNWCTRTLYLKVVCIRTVLLSLFTSQQFETEQAPERGSRSCHHWWWSPGNKYRLPSCQTRSKRCCALGKVWTYSWVYMACGKWKEIQIIIINFSLPEISKPWQERL